MDAGVNQDEGRSGFAAVPVTQAVVCEGTYGVPAHVLGAGEDLCHRRYVEREIGFERHRRRVVVGGVATRQPVLLEERDRLAQRRAERRREAPGCGRAVDRGGVGEDEQRRRRCDQRQAQGSPRRPDGQGRRSGVEHRDQVAARVLQKIVREVAEQECRRHAQDRRDPEADDCEGGSVHVATARSDQPGHWDHQGGDQEKSKHHAERRPPSRHSGDLEDTRYQLARVAGHVIGRNKVGETTRKRRAVSGDAARQHHHAGGQPDAGGCTGAGKPFPARQIVLAQAPQGDEGQRERCIACRHEQRIRRGREAGEQRDQNRHCDQRPARHL